ncbi:hypothetical protein MVEN_01028500 [Mycena venus]|uniref:Uncharacterized protein n=1 Tax=Mycena venus TaxID=2733690 RepID=A0A8H6YDX0_9AGAR|nr:hypothetical protein MVEN_01028500 [Mycena venus]
MEKEREAKEKEARERTKLVEKLLKEVERERAKQREKQLLKERERKDGGTPKAQRVTIKLKVTPKPSVGEKTEAEESSVKRIASEESADIVDKKGKGKAVEGSAEAEVNPKEDHGEEVGIWGGAGWDSELSDLTSSGASGSGSAGVSALPTPPASVGGTPEVQRLCTIARCRVPLPPFSLYRWKCCSACRKQYREYQRARLGRVAIANAAATAPPPEGPVGPNGTPPAPPPLDLPAPVWRERAERTPAEVEALRAHTAQKEWERKENLRALELAGVHPRKYREPRETKEDTEENDKGTTWTVATAAALKQPERRVEGARACIGRLCEHVIPSEIEYDWTMCGGCRGRERRKAERVLVKEGKLPAPAAGAVLDITGDFPVVEVPKPGRCMYADCGIMMPADAEGPAAACEQCVRRRTAQRRMPGRPPGSRNKPKPKLPDEKPLSTQTPPTDAPEKPLEAPKKRKRVSPYPTYQCREILLKDFGTRFRGFIEAQSYYFLIRGGMGPQPPAQSMFDFSGEYSVVAVDLDVVARKSEIEQGVHNVKDAFARAGGLEFSPTSWVSILGKPGGVVTRFACVHLVNVFLPIRVPGHQPNPATTKSMQGELEIAVLPDDSHKYFPGEKTIVRFRLVG